MPTQLELHSHRVLREMIAGRVVPFFGAGVNLCDRPDQVHWEEEQKKFLPSGSELSKFLATSFQYPDENVNDLSRVSEFVDLISGSGPLYDELHRVFDNDYPLTSLHQFFANLPDAFRKKEYPPRYQLIVTTNYDDLMEKAYAKASQEIDIVTYIASGDNAGKFLHIKPSGEEETVHKPNEYQGIELDEFENLIRPVVLKLHGAVKRKEIGADNDSYVITEDHYINYLTNTDISTLLPLTIAHKLRRSHFLFLGYGLRDWNLRVILHRLWGDQKLSYLSWAIQRDPDEIESKIWRNKGVEIFNEDLKSYIQLLQQCLNELDKKKAIS